MWDTGVLPFFDQKLLNTQNGMGRSTHKSPVMKWTNLLTLQKNSLKPNAASRTTTNRYTDADGFLDHLPSGGKPVLQGARPLEDNSGFFEVPLIYNFEGYIHIGILTNT